MTDPRTRKPITFTEHLPASATKTEIGQLADRLDRQAESIRCGRIRLPESCTQSFDAWVRYIACRPVGRKRRQLTARTQEHYTRVVTEFLATLPARVHSVKQLTPMHVEAYNASLLDRGLTCRTVNANLTAVKSFARWLTDQYGIDNFAAEVLMFSEAEPENRFLTDEEYQAVLHAASPLFRQRFEFIGNTGLRATEFCQLRWSDITPDGNAIRVFGKGAKTRYVPLNSICHRILAEIKNETPVLGTNQTIFISKNNSHGNLGGPIHRRVLYFQCEPIAKRLNLTPFGPHAFRHYFCTQLLVKGIPIAHVSKIMGHSSIRTTERIYAHILPQHLQHLTECLVAP